MTRSADALGALALARALRRGALGDRPGAPGAAHRKVLEGQSLLRPFAGPRAPVPLTNCTPLFPCPLQNWGVLGETHALVSQAWDDGFRCVELRSGREGLSLDEPACARLKQASRALWPLLPNGRPNH